MLNPFSSRQVQINPGQSEAVWKVKILDDDIYEESEDFIVKLSDPVMSIFEEPTRAEIEIIDPDDQSMVMIPEPEYTTVESIGKFRVPIKRVGDITKEFAVICSTKSGTAGGTGQGCAFSAISSRILRILMEHICIKNS